MCMPNIYPQVQIFHWSASLDCQAGCFSVLRLGTGDGFLEKDAEGPGLLILHFAYFKRATHAEKDGRWDDRSNPYMVEKAHEEALHDKVA